MLKNWGVRKAVGYLQFGLCGIRVFNNWFMLTESNLVEIDKETSLHIFSLSQDAIDASWFGYLIQVCTSRKLEFKNVFCNARKASRSTQRGCSIQTVKRNLHDMM